jgi:hypothetical protein
MGKAASMFLLAASEKRATSLTSLDSLQMNIPLVRKYEIVAGSWNRDPSTNEGNQVGITKDGKMVTAIRPIVEKDKYAPVCGGTFHEGSV